jgi:hypothetical protein
MSAPVWVTDTLGTQTNAAKRGVNRKTAAKAMDVEKFMREVVAPLRPTELFIGSALWWAPTSSQVDQHFLRTLAQAGNAAVIPQGGIAYWKTVTMPSQSSPEKKRICPRQQGHSPCSLLDRPATKVLTSYGWKVFDTLRLTLKASTQPWRYWNGLHYHCSVHNHVNEALVHTLATEAQKRKAWEWFRRGTKRPQKEKVIRARQEQRAFGAKEKALPSLVQSHADAKTKEIQAWNDKWSKLRSEKKARKEKAFRAKQIRTFLRNKKQRAFGAKEGKVTRLLPLP